MSSIDIVVNHLKDRQIDVQKVISRSELMKRLK